MRKKLIAGNWKMHGTCSEVKNLLTALVSDIKPSQNAEMAVFPPYVFLSQAQNILANSPISWGAQNMAAEIKGAYTGEVSGAMLKEFACRYVILGHSERRSLYSETDEIVAKKFLLAKEFGLVPILCVGETLAEREANQTLEVVTRQLQAVIEAGNGVNVLENSVLAYEPVWAIGTGLTATPEQAQEVHNVLRKTVAKLSPTLAEQLRILYGGSVKASNAFALLAMPDIDGGLIGGASLDAAEFLAIYQSVRE